jgi:hypothetical protein
LRACCSIRARVTAARDLFLPFPSRKTLTHINNRTRGTALSSKLGTEPNKLNSLDYQRTSPTSRLPGIIHLGNVTAGEKINAPNLPIICREHSKWIFKFKCFQRYSDFLAASNSIFKLNGFQRYSDF